MSMPLAGHISALMEKLELRDLDSLRPADRQRFAQQCRHWAGIAGRDPNTTAAAIVDEAGRELGGDGAQPRLPPREAPIWPRAAHGAGGSVGAYLAANDD